MEHDSSEEQRQYLQSDHEEIEDGHIGARPLQRHEVARTAYGMENVLAQPRKQGPKIRVSHTLVASEPAPGNSVAAKNYS